MRKRILLIIIISWLHCNCLLGQSAFVQTWYSSATGQHGLCDFIELNDSSFVLTGYIGSGGQPYSIIMKCNKYGDSLYTYMYDSSLFSGLGLASDSEIMVGDGFFDWTKGCVTASKINFITGDTLFCKYYVPGNMQASTNELHKCKDNGYIMLNYACGSYGFIKLDSNANVQWHTYHNMSYEAWDIIPDWSGGYVAVGNRGYVSDPYGVQKLDKFGNIIWNYGYGNVPSVNWSQYSAASAVVIADDSNYIVTCLNNNLSFMKINHINGDTIWTKHYLNKDSYVIASGGNDTYMVCTDSFGLINGNGEFIWQTPIVPTGFIPNDCGKTMDGGYAFCGSINYYTMAFVKLDSTGHTVNTSIYDIEKHKQVYFYPNPVSDVLNYSGRTGGNFTFSVYNFSGNKVIEVKNKSEVDVSALPAGFYVAEVKEGGEKVVREKFVKE